MTFFGATQHQIYPNADVLVVRNICKRFGSNLALNNIDIRIRRGEVQAVVGKNGAGKSTLVKIVAGAHIPEAGEMEVRGACYRSFTPISARNAGISVVYQNQEMLTNLTVAQNIFLGNEFSIFFGPCQRKCGQSCRGRPFAEASTRYPCVRNDRGITRISAPAGGDCKSRSRRGCGALLLDEPTAALNKAQAEFLFDLIRRLADDGMGILHFPSSSRSPRNR